MSTTSTVVDMGRAGAAHTRTSNTWKTDKHALGCHGGGEGDNICQSVRGHGGGDLGEYIFFEFVNSSTLSVPLMGSRQIGVPSWKN